MTPVKTQKFLGLHVDSNLSWTVHMTKLYPKLHSRMYLFNEVERLMALHAWKFYRDGATDYFTTCNRLFYRDGATDN